MLKMLGLLIFNMGIAIPGKGVFLIETAPRGPFYWHGLTLIPAWIIKYIHYKVRYEITYPFPIFNGGTIEVWEWITSIVPHFTRHVITYPCWDKSLTMLVKATEVKFQQPEFPNEFVIRMENRILYLHLGLSSG